MTANMDALSITLLLLFLVTVFQRVISAHICDEYCTPDFFLCTGKGCLLPNDPFVYIGRILTLNCTLRYEDRSHDLLFTWKNDTNISSEYQRVISPYTLQLNMQITDTNLDAVTVHCRDAMSQQLDLWSQRIEIDYPPTKVTDVKILVYHWKRLSVTWENVKYHQPDNINISVIWTDSSSDRWFECDEVNKTHCHLRNNSYHNSSWYNISITVIDTKHDESVTQYLHIYPDEYAKPPPVTSFEVASVTSRSVELRWKHSKANSKKLLFKVIGIIDDVEIRNLTVNTLNATLSCLRPFVNYQFIITAKPDKGGYWSDPTQLSVHTLSEKPDQGPNVTAGGYLSRQCRTNRRSVLIFLKRPEKEYRNGKLTHYSLTYIPRNGSPTGLVKFEVHLLQYSLHLHCDVDYDVQISVYTEEGESPASYLHIPKHESVPGVRYVKVSMNATLIKVHWESSAIPKSWTLFWCRGKYSDVITNYCQGPLSWTIVAGNKSSALVPFTRETVPNYVFAVSMTTESGSSGMTIQDCLYDVNKDLGRDNKPSIRVDSEPNLGLTVRWSLPVCADLVLITHYIIQHCPHNVTSRCVTERISSDEREHVIPDLQEGVSYMVRLKQVTVAGKEGDFSDAVVGLPVNTELKTGEIVGITFGCAILSVALSVAVIQCFRISRRKWKEKELIIMPPSVQDVQPAGGPELSPRLSEGLDETEIPSSKTMANGCVRQVSIDSGRGSLSSVTSDNPASPDQCPFPTSPTGQFQPVFEPVPEEDSLSGSVSKLDSTTFGENPAPLPQGYVQLGLNNAPLKGSDVNAVDYQVQITLKDDWDNSGGISNNGFDKSDDVDPYITAGAVDTPDYMDSRSLRVVDSSEKGQNPAFRGDYERGEMDRPGIKDMHSDVTSSYKNSSDYVTGQGILTSTQSPESRDFNGGADDKHIPERNDVRESDDRHIPERNYVRESDDKHIPEMNDVRKSEHRSSGNKFPKDEGLGSLGSEFDFRVDVETDLKKLATEAEILQSSQIFL